LDQTAVYLNRGASDVSCLLGSQKGNESAEFLRVADSSKGNIPGQFA